MLTRLFFIAVLTLICGCSYSGKVYEKDGELIFKADRPFTAEYVENSDGSRVLKMDIKGKPLLEMPNFALKN